MQCPRIDLPAKRRMICHVLPIPSRSFQGLTVTCQRAVFVAHMNKKAPWCEGGKDKSANRDRVTSSVPSPSCHTHTTRNYYHAARFDMIMEHTTNPAPTQMYHCMPT